VISGFTIDEEGLFDALVLTLVQAVPHTFFADTEEGD
jgi:hypothetical protein